MVQNKYFPPENEIGLDSSFPASYGAARSKRQREGGIRKGTGSGSLDANLGGRTRSLPNLRRRTQIAVS